MSDESAQLDWTRPALFVLASVLMAAAGAHLLETTYFASFGFQSRTGESRSAALWIREDAGVQTGVLYYSYRYLTAFGFLLLGYQCLALREWARRCMVGLLGLDLAVWLILSVAYLATADSPSLSREEILLQSAVVAVEFALLMLLTIPAMTAHFGVGGGESDHERAPQADR